MFVLLEHQPPRGDSQSPAGVPAPTPATHWDFLLELPGQELLAAWRLSENPIGRTEPVPAECIADHRRLYLDYEGPISGGRGFVRRVDRGESTVRECDQGRVLAELRGAGLSGVYEICPANSGQLAFRRVENR